ncbi:MAG: hypothetical protein ABJN26_22390 [Stappiaceae bacterium]
MIETLLYFALGFAVAGLLAFMMLPSVWRRAVRLTKREIEAMSPMNQDEAAAARDLMRAEYSIKTRRLELNATKLQENANLQRIDLDRTRQRITELLAEQDQKNRQVESLETEISDLQSQISAPRVGNTSSGPVRVPADRQFLENTLRQERNKLEQARAEIARLENQLANEKTKQTIDTTRQIALDSEVSGLARQLEKAEETKLYLVKELELSQQKIANIELAAEQESAKPKRGRKSNALKAEEKKVLDLTQKLEKLEHELAHAKPGDNLDKALANSESERKSADRELAAARVERDGLKAENAALQARMQILSNNHAQSENLDITREKLTDFAAQVAALAATMEGTASPVDEILKDSAAKGGISVNSLADKIQQLRLGSADGYDVAPPKTETKNHPAVVEVRSPSSKKHPVLKRLPTS